MSKYLFKVIDMFCENCGGKGHTVHTSDISPYNFNCNCDEWRPCKECKETGKIRITSKAKDFKKYYIKQLEWNIEELNLKLSDVRKRESDIMKEMKKYCKELDKFVNKKDGRK